MGPSLQIGPDRHVDRSAACRAAAAVCVRGPRLFSDRRDRAGACGCTSAAKKASGRSGHHLELAGGALGAIGALGIILAFTFGGKPIYVMPLVFGGAPVVNAFLTIYLARRMKEIGPLFLAGLIIVVLGAVVVLVSAPHSAPHAALPASRRELTHDAAPSRDRSVPQTALSDSWLVCSCLRLRWRLCSWGAYGPVLHKGQAAMHHSRLRPLICVGLAYFVIAVIVPYFFLGEMGEDSTYRSLGTLWSLLGGTFGARRRTGHHHGVQLRRQAGVCDAAGVRRCTGDQHVRCDRRGACGRT